MKQAFIIIASLVALASCSSPTKIVNSWHDPETRIKDPKVHRIVVAALIYDQGVRRQVEDYMASLYAGAATQSYVFLGGDSLMTYGEDYYNQRLKSESYDGIVIMRQVGENVSQHYVPGQMPSYYSTWGGYWGHSWGTTFYNPGTPGHMRTDRTWHVQVNVYSIAANKLIYTASTNTTDPGGRVPLFEDVCKAVKKDMKKGGFLD